MLRILILVIAIGAGACGAGGLGWLWSVTQDLPTVKTLRSYEPPITTRVHAGDGMLVAEFARQHRVFVPAEELPQQLVNAFISAEDKSFFEHEGIDLIGLARGTVGNAVRGRRMTGGSTITQQVVKNMLVGDERSAVRKMREAFVAKRIETVMTKDKILELYLNEIYLGGRSYGVGAASLNYFGKSLRDLSLAECALLAAMPKAPGKVNPYKNPEAAIARRDWVLSRMAINGYISAEDAAKAQAEPLTTVERLSGEEIQAAAYFVEEVRREILRSARDGQLTGVELEIEDGEDEDAAARKLAEKLLYEQGLSVRSTLDSRHQVSAQRALQDGLETYDRRHGFRGPLGQIDTKSGWNERLDDIEMPRGMGHLEKAVVLAASSQAVTVGLADERKVRLAESAIKWSQTYKRNGGSGLRNGDVIMVSAAPPADVLARTVMDPVELTDGAPWHLRQEPKAEGALVAMDPHTGRVLAMAGGYSFQRSQFNRAIQAYRQPGSSFKPLVYAAALDNGWTPADTVLDGPFVIDTPQGPWKPANYSAGQFYGESTLRLGIEKSRNLMTARLAQDVGMDTIAEYGRKFGIYPTPPADATPREQASILNPQTYLSRSLGAGDTTPIKMATAYSIMVNGGKQVEPVLLDRIQDRYGHTILRRDMRECFGCDAPWEGQAPPQLADDRAQVIDPVTAYQSVSMMQGVVQRGTATRVKAVGKPIAGKTGTTNDYVDAWFVGFTPDLVAAVWVGMDTPKSLGEAESGGRVAAPIFRDFMMLALQEAPYIDFRVPAGARLVEIDARTGKLPDENTTQVILEAFKPGTEPGGYDEGVVDFFERDRLRQLGMDTPVDGTSTGGGDDWEQGYPVGSDPDDEGVFMQPPPGLRGYGDGVHNDNPADAERDLVIEAEPPAEVDLSDKLKPLEKLRSGGPIDGFGDQPGEDQPLEEGESIDPVAGSDPFAMPTPEPPPPEQSLDYGIH